MATFTITVPTNIDSLTGKTGGDVYNVNGSTLTIDQHSRFGLNNANTSTTAATSMAAITISATLGGTVNIDGRFVRMIPFNSGTGTIPALNSVVAQGSASGLLMCVYSSLTAAPLVNGAAMPATGWIMIKQWNSIAFAAGAITLSGTTSNSTGADFQGFLEIMGDEAATATINRLGSFNILGAWYLLGTTNGSAGQTFQVPNHGTLRHIAGVFIEKSVGSEDYEFYPNGGTSVTTGTTVATGTEAARGKSVWVNNAGLVTIGNSGGTGLNGHVPVSGLKVVVPNIFLCNCGTAARNAVIIPNATIATRYDFTATGGGVFTCDKANFEWYPSFSQAYSVQISNSGIIDSLLLSEIASPMTITKVGVGNKPTTALVTAPLNMSLCFSGGTFSECVFQRVVTTGNSTTSVILTDMDGFTFTDCRFQYNALRAHTGPTTITATRVNNSNFNTCKIIDGAISLVTCTNTNINNLIYINAIVGTTGTTNPLSAINISSNCLNIKVDGVTLPITNNHPYTALITIGAAGCTNIKIRNIGTRVSPLNLGSANACGLLLTLAAGAAANTVKLQRLYVSNTRTGFWTADNSSTKVTLENCYGDYADAADVIAALNTTFKGYGGTLALTAQTGVYGTHFAHYFTSTTAGRVAWLMNEATTLTSTQISLSGGAAFTATGGLYMPTIGQTATFTNPDFIEGHTSFQNSALVMAGGTVANYRFRYQIDKGSGFGAWSDSDQTAAQLGTLLNAETGIDPAIGFKLKLEVKTTTTNSTAITSMYVLTNSSAAAQDNQYPLDVNNLTLTGLVPGTEVNAYSGANPSTATLIASVESSTTSFSFQHEFSSQVGYITLIKPGYIFLKIPLTYINSEVSIPVFQNIDRTYINP
jgi:hypothetical protein